MSVSIHDSKDSVSIIRLTQFINDHYIRSGKTSWYYTPKFFTTLLEAYDGFFLLYSLDGVVVGSLVVLYRNITLQGQLSSIIDVDFLCVKSDQRKSGIPTILFKEAKLHQQRLSRPVTKIIHSGSHVIPWSQHFCTVPIYYLMCQPPTIDSRKSLVRWYNHEEDYPDIEAFGKPCLKDKTLHMPLEKEELSRELAIDGVKALVLEEDSFVTVFLEFLTMTVMYDNIKLNISEIMRLYVKDKSKMDTYRDHITSFLLQHGFIQIFGSYDKAFFGPKVVEGSPLLFHDHMNGTLVIEPECFEYVTF